MAAIQSKRFEAPKNATVADMLSEQASIASSIGPMGSCAHCQPLAGPLSQCAQNTTVEGLPNLISAGSLSRKVIWTVILLGALTGCTVHMVKLIVNFSNSGVYSTMILDADVVEFPDVTICGLKPMSESLISESLKRDLTYYITDMMRRIDSWFYFELGKSRAQKQNETLVEYYNRMMLFFYKLFEIVRLDHTLFNAWLNMNYETSILNCKFNNIPCQSSNFSLIQHNDHFNCLTFSPHEQNKMADSGSNFESGLHINIYTDSSMLDSAYQTFTEYTAPKRTYYYLGLLIHEFLNAKFPKEFPVNTILSKGRNPNGVLVIVHPRNTYPFNDHPSYIIRSGSSGSFRISTFEQNKINYRGREPCTKEPLGEVTYNTVLAAEKGTRKRTFVRIPEDARHDWVQNEVFSQCGCYSHRIPSEARPSDLCYHVGFVNDTPPQNLSEKNIRRIECHDRSLDKALSAAIDQVKLKKPCHTVYREIQLDSIDWPSDEDIVPIAASFINMQEPISNDSYSKALADDSLANITKFLRRFSAVNSISSCPDIANLLEKNFRDAAKCLKLEVVKENVVRLLVRLDSPYTVAYNETYSYEWIEVLSELGGVIGLWFGMSLLTVFELLDLVWVIVTWEQQSEERKKEYKGVKQLELVLFDEKPTEQETEFIASGCSVFLDE